MMSFARGFKIIITALVICAIAGLLVWAFIQGRIGLMVEQEREKPITVAKRVSIAHGETVITLDEVTQKTSGIDTKALVSDFSVDTERKHTPGVVIPDSAVVWLDGRAWAYVQKGRESFIRQEVVTSHPVVKGWFVTKKFQNGDRVVVQGAQLLLSEEFRAQIQIGD
jgi:hypothetical protein